MVEVKPTRLAGTPTVPTASFKAALDETIRRPTNIL